MIPQTFSDLNKIISLVTDLSQHKTASTEYRKLQNQGKSKFVLKKIFHEADQHIYVYQMGTYIAIEQNDIWSLNDTVRLEQIKMPL